MTLLLVKIFPTVTARRGYNGRDTVFRAIKHYLECRHFENSSDLMKVRHYAAAKNGLSLDDEARFEFANAIGVLVNTAPTTFWVLTHVYQDCALLKALRSEVEQVTSSEGTDTYSSDDIRVIDVAKLQSECPLLESTYQEVLRFHSFGTSVRMALEDTLLLNRYLLKKGSTIQIPSHVLHSDAAMWGPDAESFNARWFMHFKSLPSGFRAFGGGKTMCLGKHFAMAEVIVVVAAFVMGYDITPTKEKSWASLTQCNNNLATSVLPPDRDIRVKVTKRTGYETVVWKFAL